MASPNDDANLDCLYRRRVSRIMEKMTTLTYLFKKKKQTNKLLVQHLKRDRNNLKLIYMRVNEDDEGLENHLVFIFLK